MQMITEKGWPIVERCKRCSGEMLYFVLPSRNGAPYHFDRICVKCITPAEWAHYYQKNGIKPLYCTDGCGNVTSKNQRLCPSCQASKKDQNHDQ
jgi:hypothetical protein